MDGCLGGLRTDMGEASREEELTGGSVWREQNYCVWYLGARREKTDGGVLWDRIDGMVMSCGTEN